MKIALTSTGRDLTSDIDPRFGRCAYFIVFDPDTMHFEVLENENKDLSRGAGIQAATFIASKGVKTVITGSCGPNAIQVLSTANIDLCTGEAGKTVKESLERFKNGILMSSKTTGPQNEAIPGMESVAGKNPQPFIPPERNGSGRGMGGGRGMRGCGRGLGGGRGMGGGKGRGGGGRGM